MSMDPTTATKLADHEVRITKTEKALSDFQKMQKARARAAAARRRGTPKGRAAGLSRRALKRPVSASAQPDIVQARDWFARDLDPDTAAAWLVDVAEWLGEVFAHLHDGDPLPPCWPLHPRAVQELLTLSEHHAEAWAGPPAAARSDYLARWFDGGAKRITQLLNRSGCDDKRHEHPELGPTTVDLDLADVATWWCKDRTATPPGVTGTSY